MAANLQVCDICPSLKEKLMKFKMRREKNVAAIVLKIDREKKMVILDEQYEDIEIDDLQNELPTSQPRYVLLSYIYKSSDGRVSYPFCFIYVCPPGGNTDLMMMYAGTKQAVVRLAEVTKVFEVRSVDEFTDEFLQEKMAFFK